MTSTAEAVYRQAFNRARQPRSPEYKNGVRAALAYRLEGQRIRKPHPVGTAQADAFFSGLDEGHALWRQPEHGAST